MALTLVFISFRCCRRDRTSCLVGLLLALLVGSTSPTPEGFLFACAPAALTAALPLVLWRPAKPFASAAVRPPFDSPFESLFVVRHSRDNRFSRLAALS